MAEKPEYEKLLTVDEIEDEIAKHKDVVCRKVKERGQVRSNKKDAMKGYNDELKEIEAQLDFNTEVLDELDRCKRVLLANSNSPHLASV